MANLPSLSAAHLGLPKLIREEDVHCEYPVDADDEYVTEKGFLPTLPGESTKLSSALALFRLSRILSRTLAELYPTSSTHDIAFRTVAALTDELDQWQNNLAPHLKLTFAQDKPSTNVTSSRAPILVSHTRTRCAITSLLTCCSLWHITTSSLLSIVPLLSPTLVTRAHLPWLQLVMLANILYRSYSCLMSASLVSLSASTAMRCLSKQDLACFSRLSTLPVTVS